MSGEVSDQDRFIAYLLCRGVDKLDSTALAEAIERRFPQLGLAVEPLNLQGLEGSGFGFLVGSIPMSCVIVPAPLPSPEWSAGARANKAWPEAAQAIADHTTHIILSAVSVVSDHLDALKKGYTTTLVAAALLDSIDASAVCWWPAHTLISPSAFNDMSEAMVSATDMSALPLDAWMRLEFGRMDGRYVAAARGLVPFIGHDMGVLGNIPDPVMQGAVLYDVTGHMIRNGPVFKDGDTVDTALGAFCACFSPDGSLLWLEPRGKI